MALTLSACATAPLDPARVDASVVATFETERVAGTGDAADDPAIWFDASGAPHILGTDKTRGLYAYAMDGAIVEFQPWGRVNNVDVQPGFRLRPDAPALPLGVATDRVNMALRIFSLEPAPGVDARIMADPGGMVPLDVGDPYGACLGHGFSQRDGISTFYAVATGKDGEVRQFSVAPSPSGGALVAQEVRAFSLSSISEGCVIDARTDTLYIAEENVGIWRFDLNPTTGEAKTQVAAVDGIRLVADVEGLAIYEEGANGGYLIASSQGDSAYALFALPDHRYVGRFAIVDGVRNGQVIDGTTETDGIDVTSTPSAQFPAGFFVAQDDADDTGGQNFKVVDWRAIAVALGLE